MELFNSILSESPEVWQVIVILAVTLVLSLGFGLIYCLVKQKDGYFKDMPITYVIFPIVVAAFTIAISALCYTYTGTNTEARYGRLAVAAISALIVVRFRTQQRTTEDMTYLFFLTAFGFVCGMGYVFYALIIWVVVVALVLVLYKFNFPLMSHRNLNLKVTIPEDLNYENVFDDIFNKYTKYSKLTKVKTSDLGTMFVLNYEIIVRPGVSTKEMVDEIRARNGNLNVVLTVKKYTSIDA